MYKISLIFKDNIYKYEKVTMSVYPSGMNEMHHRSGMSLMNTCGEEAKNMKY